MRNSHKYVPVTITMIIVYIVLITVAVYSYTTLAAQKKVYANLQHQAGSFQPTQCLKSDQISTGTGIISADYTCSGFFVPSGTESILPSASPMTLMGWTGYTDDGIGYDSVIYNGRQNKVAAILYSNGVILPTHHSIFYGTRYYTATSYTYDDGSRYGSTNRTYYQYLNLFSNLLATFIATVATGVILAVLMLYFVVIPRRNSKKTPPQP